MAVLPAADDPSSFAGPAAPPPEGWLRLGSGFGLPALWMTVCLMILPLAIYMALYIPWAVPWQQETADSGPLPVLMCWNTDANGDRLTSSRFSTPWKKRSERSRSSEGTKATASDVSSTSPPWG